MKRSQILMAVGMVLIAAALIGTGLLKVYRVYQHYRSDILTNESRHLHSIVSASAGGLDWMIGGYDGQLGMLVNRPEFAAAEAEYAESGDPAVMKALMGRRDIVRMDMRYCVAVREDDTVLGMTSVIFPVNNENDEQLGDICTLRVDGAGRYWLVFSRTPRGGLRYELAVQVQTLFAYQGSTARVGRTGYLFMLDCEERFISYSTKGETETVSVESLLASNSYIDREALDQIAGDTGDGYLVFRYPWSGGIEETLVVTAPVLASGGALRVGAAMSFSEFDSFLSNTMKQIGWIILLEIAGALILFAMAAWVMVVNRRNALELDVVRERADLMEEINRQQQSLYHTERLQQLGVMTSGIVHEFNNLLTPVMGQSLLLLEELADSDGTPEFEYALDVYEASEKAKDILKRMSSMGKKDVDLGFKTIEMGALLKKTMNLSSMAKDPHILQELNVPNEPILILGNEQLLTQAFLNLCINACQAMGDKGMLTVEAERVIQSGRPYVIVRVSDTGPGIPEEALNSIYDPFFTTKGERGTGLGLAICKKIIETHKGTIVAENRPEGGAMFTVQLPVTELPED